MERGKGREEVGAGAARQPLRRLCSLDLAFSLAAAASVGGTRFQFGGAEAEAAGGGSPTTQMFQAWRRGPCGLGKLRGGEEEGTRDMGLRVGGPGARRNSGLEPGFCQPCME